jgi:uncharacterized protein (TIGR03435 family)
VDIMLQMSEPDDHQLLAEFVRDASGPAFASVVARYVNLVYSTAFRFTGNAHHSEEVSQAVFIILARKAEKLSSRVVLSGWLYQTTRLTAANFMKAEIRRQRREQEAYMQSTLNEPNDAAWREIGPLLDEAMGRLGTTDRDAVVLRYFENKNSAEIGSALRMTEETARRRVNRALEKLRKFFARRGIVFTAAIIGGSVSANSVHAAPAGLVKTISTVAAAKGATYSTSTLTLVKGVLKIMAWTKAKTAIVAGAVILLAAGTTTVTVHEVQEHRTYPWQVPQASFGVFYKMPAAVIIVPTKFPNATNGGWCGDSSRGVMGIAQPVKQIIQVAWRYDDHNTVDEADLPTNRYDFIAKLVGPEEPHKNTPQNEHWRDELQKLITRQFGIRCDEEMRNTDVLVLRPAPGGPINFKESHKMPNGRAIKTGRGSFAAYEQPLFTLIYDLGYRFKVPIVDQTGLTKMYDYSVKWDEPDPKQPNPDGLKQALVNQLGLELVATNMPIKMLVIKKAE